ncbi:MAG: class II aldolase/adducin family protein [Oscillospiraceae bacterium]|nr:class II aldolase/adducin family protein [Oscillospiraceae bacterium]
MEEKKALICAFGKKLWQRGYVAANDGNISISLGDGEYLITPAGVSKGEMTPDMILHVDGEGRLLSPSVGRPSSEWPMHRRCYALRPDVFAVVHAHPVAATAFACARQPLDARVLGEFLMALGTVPVAPYGRTGTMEIPAAIAPLLPDHNGILLANHGALTLGPDLETAYYRMESLEHTAQVYLALRQLGGGVPLTEQEAAALNPHI